MIHWFEPRMTGREADAVSKVLVSGYVNDGPITREFERQVAAICGRQFGVAVPNGTCAIFLALLAAGANPGDDVIVPDFTYIATANAVRLAGCNVVLADVDKDNFSLIAKDIDAVRTTRTRFVIPVEVNGRLPDYDGDLMPYCFANGIEIITDSCEALGSGGHWGAASCFSFSPNKLVTTGQGGMVVTNYPRIRDRLIELKQQGLRERGDGGAALHNAVGYNFKFTDIQAAIGIEQLKELPYRLEHSLERDSWYRQELNSTTEIQFPSTSGALWTDILTDCSMQIERIMRELKVGIRKFWIPLHRQPPYRFDKQFPNSTDISRRGLWLPSFFGMTQMQVIQVCEAIKKSIGPRLAA